MKNWIVGVVLAVAVAGCDSASDVTLLENAATTTVPVSFDVDALVGTSFPGGSGISGVSIGYSNGLWLAIGGRSPYEFQMSEDWDSHPSSLTFSSAVMGPQLWASNDGVIWEPRDYPELLGQHPIRVAVSSSGVWLVETCETFGYGAACHFWASTEGEVWAETDLSSESGTLKSVVSQGGDCVALLEVTFSSDLGGLRTKNRVFRSSDGGTKWTEVPFDGEPYAVTDIGGDIVAWGSSLGKPTRWCLSTGWRPEFVDGLGSAEGVFSVVEVSDGSFVLVGGSPGQSVRTWFASTDLESWHESVIPAGVPRNAFLSQAGPFLIAEYGDSQQDRRRWVSLDGRDWGEANQNELFGSGSAESSDRELERFPIEFASDGWTLVGVFLDGIVSDHAMVFSGSDYPGGWEELVSLNCEQEVFGVSEERFFVGQGKVFEITEGSVVPLPDAPVVFPDAAHVDVTESALFVQFSGEAWVFIDGSWAKTSLPVSDGPILRGSEPQILVVEQGGVFVGVTVERGLVRKSVSQDGLSWISAEVEPLAATAVVFEPDGWMMALLPEYEEKKYAPFPFKFSLDGFEWTVWDEVRSRPSAEFSGNVITVHLAEGDVEFELPSDTTYLSTVSWSAEQVALSVKKEGEPYLLVLTSDGEEVWARRDIYDPLIGDVWYDGEFLYGTNSQPTSGQFVYVWNPDAD